MNVFETVPGIQARAEYTAFESAMERQSKACLQITPADSMLQELREPNDAVCRACDMEAAACDVGRGSESSAGAALVAVLAALASF